MVYRAAEGVPWVAAGPEAGGNTALPAGITSQEAWRIGEQFIEGLVDGSIPPETGVRIVSQLFIDAVDGVLTNEEIRSILEQVRRARNMNL